ncbi:hypothetical protein [Thermomonospora umbrina]|uniref:hypothetical protein n=1 Tax=Thermomonospora umbrina TaxID=111806 RepID=UPI00147683ED|nr:hypothetical protein [Thermomonospora umbrina]
MRRSDRRGQARLGRGWSDVGRWQVAGGESREVGDDVGVPVAPSDLEALGGG